MDSLRSMEVLLGRDVEVKSVEPGLEGSWYEAQVVRWMWKSERVRVEYRTLVCEGNESKPLSEAVLLSNVRPRPLPLPEEEGSELHLQDWVEAFYRDGWWVGVIVDKVPETSTYTVFFPDSNENIEFERSLLRLHKHWDGGKWVSGPVEDVQESEGQDSVGDKSVQAGNTSDGIEGESLNLSKRKTLHDEMNALLSRKKSKKKASAGISSPLKYLEATNDDETLNEGVKQQRARTEGNLKVRKNLKFTRAEEQASNACDEMLHEQLGAPQLEGRVNIPVTALDETPSASTQVQREEIICERQNQCLHQPSEDQLEQANVEKSTAIVLFGKGSSKYLALPFVKSSPGWQIVESMEPFNTLPQSPHFSPLGQSPEELDVFREGQALGYMFVFERVVNLICKSQLSDDDSHFEKILRLLQRLEGHGFTVQPLRAIVEEMLRLKHSFLQSENELTTAEKWILDRVHEKDSLGKEIDAIDRDIATLQEKKASLIEMMEKTETDIKQLQPKLQLLKQASHDEEENFKKVAAALLPHRG